MSMDNWLDYVALFVVVSIYNSLTNFVRIPWHIEDLGWDVELKRRPRENSYTPMWLYSNEFWFHFMSILWSRLYYGNDIQRTTSQTSAYVLDYIHCFIVFHHDQFMYISRGTTWIRNPHAFFIITTRFVVFLENLLCVINTFSDFIFFLSGW